MASEPIEVYYDPGKTLTYDLYARDSDTLAIGSQTLTEETNRDGVYKGTVVSSLAGYYTLHLFEGSRKRGIFDIYLTNTTSTAYAMTVGDQVAMSSVAIQIFNLHDLSVADIRSAVGLASGNLDTQLGNIPTNSEFNARTLTAAAYFDPATDTVNVGKVSGSTTAATNMKYINEAPLVLTVDNATFSPTTTAFETDGTITADDTLIGMAVTWASSAANDGTFFIEASEGTTTNANNKLKITTETLPSAPANGDVLLVIGSKVR